MEEKCLDKHERILTLEEVVFGDPKKGEMGMKQKVDEIHEILVQARGLKGFLYIMIAIGGLVAVLKGWFIK